MINVFSSLCKDLLISKIKEFKFNIPNYTSARTSFSKAFSILNFKIL